MTNTQHRHGVGWWAFTFLLLMAAGTTIAIAQDRHSQDLVPSLTNATRVTANSKPSKRLGESARVNPIATIGHAHHSKDQTTGIIVATEYARRRDSRMIGTGANSDKLGARAIVSNNARDNDQVFSLGLGRIYGRVL